MSKNYFSFKYSMIYFIIAFFSPLCQLIQSFHVPQTMNINYNYSLESSLENFYQQGNSSECPRRMSSNFSLLEKRSLTGKHKANHLSSRWGQLSMQLAFHNFQCSHVIIGSWVFPQISLLLIFFLSRKQTPKW